MRRLLLVAAAAAFAAGCSDQGPVSGELSVRAATAYTGVRGMQFLVVGPVRGVRAPTGAGYQVFTDAPSSGDTTHVVVISSPSASLLPGEVARIAVNDTRTPRSYSAHVTALASATYLLMDTAGVALTVVKP